MGIVIKEFNKLIQNLRQCLTHTTSIQIE